jgi:hypothetical protein
MVVKPGLRKIDYFKFGSLSVDVAGDTDINRNLCKRRMRPGRSLQMLRSLVVKIARHFERTRSIGHGYCSRAWYLSNRGLASVSSSNVIRRGCRCLSARRPIRAKCLFPPNPPVNWPSVVATISIPRLNWWEWPAYSPWLLDAFSDILWPSSNDCSNFKGPSQALFRKLQHHCW